MVWVGLELMDLGPGSLGLVPGAYFVHIYIFTPLLN